MSIVLTNQNLAGLTVGQGGFIDLASLYGQGGIAATLPSIGGKQGTLRLHNDSGSGLYMNLNNSNQQFNLPAGGWQDCYPMPGDTQLSYQVLYVLPDPPVQLLLSTYYYPNESLPAMTILGNSPVGIGGSINVANSSVNNVGNAPGANWLNVQPSDASSPTWSADNIGNLAVYSDLAGVLTLLFKLVAGVSPQVVAGVAMLLQSSFTVDGTTTLDAGAATPITTDANGNMTFGSSASGGTGGKATFNNGLSLHVGGFKSVASGNFSASGTYNHGLGGTPTNVLLCPSVSGSTWTFSAYSFTSTQFSATINSALNTDWFAYR